MKILKFSGFLCFVVVMLTMFSTPAIAGSSYYSKVTAKAVGEGKVYANYNSVPNSPNYAAESSATSGKQSDKSHTYYLCAQANDGFEFAGWFTNEQCSGESVSMGVVNNVTVNATSTDSSKPTVVNYYAKFVEAGSPSLVYVDTHVYVNLSVGTYKNETLSTKNLTAPVEFESSNENVATVAYDGTVTLVKNGSCFVKAKSGDAESSYMITVIDNISAGVTQIGNGDFEDWRGVTTSNHAPNNWNSFETAEGSLAGLSSAQQIQMVEDHRPGSNGFYCADIWSRSVLGVIAQGNVTTGCINAGGMSATAKNNYNYSKTSDAKKSETLSKVPTAIRFWAKFVPAAVNTQHPNAHMEAAVHDNCNYITYSDPSYQSAEEKSHVIAKAVKNFPTTNGEWEEFTVPFEKTCNAANGQLYIIVNIATNSDPGQGQSDDHLYVDDVELLYDTEYTEASIVMTDAKYATFCAPFDVNVPYGMTAYTVDDTKADNQTLDLNEVSGTIPANTPVILSGNTAKSLTAYGVAAPATAEAGMLTGVYENTAAPVGSYVLQNVGGVLGFYQVALGQQPTIKANRCYLTTPVLCAKALYFNEDDATAINEVQGSKNNIQDGVIFNAAGQRINKVQKGINIVNGKKILK